MENHVKKIEDYLEYLRGYEYEEEQLEEVRKVRENCEHMTQEQFQVLFEQGIIKRFIKLKRFKRTLWVNENGEILYLNHVYKRWDVVAKFIN